MNAVVDVDALAFGRAQSITADCRLVFAGQEQRIRIVVPDRPSHALERQGRRLLCADEDNVLVIFPIIDAADAAKMSHRGPFPLDTEGEGARFPGDFPSNIELAYHQGLSMSRRAPNDLAHAVKSLGSPRHMRLRCNAESQ